MMPWPGLRVSGTDNEAFKVVFSNPVSAQLDSTRDYASGFIAENDPAAPPPVPVVPAIERNWTPGIFLEQTAGQLGRT